MSSRVAARSGFTLVEVMLAVAVLALLVAIALPRFTNRQAENRTAAMVASLSVLRTAIDTYWTQHDRFPGQAGAAEFANQLLKSTNKAGNVGTGTGFGYGPYVHNGKLPANPLTGTNSLMVVTAMPAAPEGTEAWIYATSTGEIHCNVAGQSSDGVDYFAF